MAAEYIPPDVPPGSKESKHGHVIEAFELATGYTEKLILKRITANIHRDAITCVIGGSGCGKSTFMKAAIGTLAPRKGYIKLFDQEVYKLQDKERDELLSRVGFMFQYGALLASISVEENLSIPVRAHTNLPPDVIQDMIMMKLEMMKLGHAPKLLPSELSGGMRKRVGLARAIMLDPELVFCDEPSAGLDPVTGRVVDELILEMRELLGMTMVIVTHELESIKAIADRIVMLVKGYVHFDGTLEEALNSEDPELRSFFDRKSETAEHKGRTFFDMLSSAQESP